MSYKNRFLGHLFQFISNKQAWKNATVKIAVSGGVDSMTLLWSMIQLQERLEIKQLEAIFIHHQTRRGQDEDLSLVKNFCHDHEIPITIHHVQWPTDFNQSNFEARARKERYLFFQKHTKQGAIVLLGHHLDDALEWSLMQEWRNTSGLFLGMPLKRGNFFRPFFCVSRRQILKMAKLALIPFREDPTNEDFKHTRNYLRHKLLPPIKKIYPSMLRRFVLKQQEKHQLVQSLNTVFEQKTVKGEVGIHLLGKINVWELKKALHYFCHRGEWQNELFKLLKAQSNNKNGPMMLSEGVYAYFNQEHIFLTKAKISLVPINVNSLPLKPMRNLFYAEVVNVLPSYLKEMKKGVFPCLVLVKNNKNAQAMNLHSCFYQSQFKMLPEESKEFYILPVMHLLRKWKKHLNTELSLRFLF